jgi:hypothetical protein
MNFRVNINGTSRDELQKQASQLFTACSQMAAALRDAYPHGRDYQTCDLPAAARAADTERFDKALDALNVIQEMAADFARTAAK